ncbi:MAG: hypothetical protein RIS63_1338, partial [Bacteroidota bacterium]
MPRINGRMDKQYTFSFRIIPSLQELASQDQVLVSAAQAALKRAYAPYS